MKKIEIGGVDSFIGAWMLDKPEVCDELIEYFKNSDRKVEGLSYDANGVNRVDKSYKESIDCPIYPIHQTDTVVVKYLTELKTVVGKYLEQYAYATAYGPWGIPDIINIQYYPPGGGFKAYHAERTNAKPPASTRHLVFMTYLNDLSDNGGTEFFYQKTISPARRGLTLIWPADWTHTHRGVISETEEKYIITGWFNYL